MSGTAPAAATGELRLEAVAGKARGFSVVVDDRLVIGRNSEGAGRLADDPEISRHHAEIARVPTGEFTIMDLASTNGTYVNGARLTDATVLRSGDEIEVGGTKLMVRSAPVATKRADVDVRAATVTVDVPPPMRRPAGEASPGAWPPPVAEPAPVAEPLPETRAQPLQIMLSVDFSRETVELSVQGGVEPVRLDFERGQWRMAEPGAG
jgi:pSer/pThr/pTyr-binding forkhead associated (FHA) protein